jgi:hypothetical protein
MKPSVLGDLTRSRFLAAIEGMVIDSSLGLNEIHSTDRDSFDPAVA